MIISCQKYDSRRASLRPTSRPERKRNSRQLFLAILHDPSQTEATGDSERLRVLGLKKCALLASASLGHARSSRSLFLYPAGTFHPRSPFNARACRSPPSRSVRDLWATPGFYVPQRCKRIVLLLRSSSGLEAGNRMHSGSADTAAGPVTFWAPPPAVLKQSSRRRSRKSRVVVALVSSLRVGAAELRAGAVPPKRATHRSTAGSIECMLSCSSSFVPRRTLERLKWRCLNPSRADAMQWPGELTVIPESGQISLEF